jgi:hypothetical protein
MIIYEGKEYVTEPEAMEALYTRKPKHIAKWRQMGMPHLRVKVEGQYKYLYHLPDCRRWFAGEQFSEPLTVVGMDQLEVIH